MNDIYIYNEENQNFLIQMITITFQTPDTGLRRLQCNREIHSDHDNIGVNIFCPLDKNPSYVIRREDVINVLCAMKCTKLQKHWIIYVGDRSAVLIEAIYDKHLWNEIWNKLQQT